MKKIVCLFLSAIIAVTLVGCGSTSTFTIDELKTALISKNIEVDEIDVVEQEGAYTFAATIDDEFKLNGTADENQMVNYVRFENIGLDTSVFSTNDIFEKWYSNALKGDISSMTLKQLSQTLVALNCINELEAFYLLVSDSNSDIGDGLTFAINTLLTKASSEIEDWEVEVVANSSDNTIVIEARYIK